MAKEFLGDREQALEQSYFHKEEQKLFAKMREKMDREADKKELAESASVADEAVLDQLVSARASSAL